MSEVVWRFPQIRGLLMGIFLSECLEHPGFEHLPITHSRDFGLGIKDSRLTVSESGDDPPT